MLYTSALKGIWAVSLIVSILILGTFGFSQEVEATTITISDEPSCLAIPGATFLGGSSPGCIFINDFTVGSGDILIIENLFVQIRTSVFTNFGTVELNGGTGTFTGLFAVQFGEIINECGGVINANGGVGTLSGALIAFVSSSSITNKGTINLFGSTGGQSGLLGIVSSAIVNNHGTVSENPGDGNLSGIVLVVGGTFNDNLPNLCSIQVDIDIKPGSDPNCINPKNKGSVPVSILGSVDFDVTTIDTSTLEIDDDETPGGGITPTKISIKDVNGDGFDDLNLKFASTALLGAGLLVDNNELFITGELTVSTQIVGSDIINLAGGPNCFD